MEQTKAGEEEENLMHNNSWSISSLSHKFPEKIRPFQMPRISQIFDVLPLGLRLVII